MIGSFWNLCRACPSMPVDKLHSEYRSTYRWHEYTGPRQEVVRRAPQGSHANAAPPSDEKRHDFQKATRIDEESTELPKLEPALHRRKKYPDLAYRHHEFIVSDGCNFGDDRNNYADRARSEERGVSHWRPSRRSKSEGPSRSNNLNNLTNGERRRESDPDIPDIPDIPDMEDTGRDSGLLKKAISKISTEYRLQFAWPQGHTSRRDATDAAPRKSQSMGALKPAANAMIHRKRLEHETKDGTASELEPLVNDSTIKEEDFGPKGDTEYNKEYKPFNNYGYDYHRKLQEELEVKPPQQNGTCNSEWYKEVVELRKKAGEYKSRGWNSTVAPEKVTDIFNKQIELWDQVSRRSSLSALSLAATAHRSYTKEEKDEENTKKSSPTKALRNAENSARIVKDMIRHHLERTTGGSEFDGLILSPTREKLEPTIPKRDDDSRGSQKNSPKKNSPQKTALQKKNSLKSKSALRTARSQSVGPVDMTSTEKRSPKRQSRSVTVKEKKSANATTNNTPSTKKPRPSSLNTTASSRSKSSSVPPKLEDDRLAKSKSNKNNSNASKEPARGSSAVETAKTEETNDKLAPEATEPEPIDLDPVVKSPPEPTRVKSPEQIIMRSPDPVNWTVPLDTGKTFTVTQNIREGDLASRPHSEVKAWTPPDIPPPNAQSAPPELLEQCKNQVRKAQDNSSDITVSSSNLDRKSVISEEEQQSPTSLLPVVAVTENPVVDRPLLDVASTATSLQPKPCPYKSLEAAPLEHSKNSKSLASDVLQKAKDRFDNFWKKTSSEEPV